MPIKTIFVHILQLDTFCYFVNVKYVSKNFGFDNCNVETYNIFIDVDFTT